MMVSLNGSYGVCNWFPEHGDHLVAPSDLSAFAALRPAGKVFKCVGSEEGMLVLQYGDRTYRVSPDTYKPVPAPALSIGAEVEQKGRRGTVVDVEWHFKNSTPIYYVAFDGKRSSRRYSEDELAAG